MGGKTTSSRLLWGQVERRFRARTWSQVAASLSQHHYSGPWKLHLSLTLIIRESGQQRDSPHRALVWLDELIHVEHSEQRAAHGHLDVH